MPYKKRRRRGDRASHLLLLLPVALIILASHAPFYSLPFYWDEIGQFIPAALDLYRHGDWIARSTTPNVHPPGVMAYLAGVWTLTGYSIPATRIAMLLLASVGAYATFLLGVELCRNVRGVPAFLGVAFLLASPLFFAQSMLAQLDMPAMVFSTLAFAFFLKERWVESAISCVLLVLMKETGVMVPVLFGLWLIFERRFREAVLFLLPIGLLAGWILFFRLWTGSWTGDQHFASYNLEYLLHPVRAAVALAKRLYFLFVENFHWVGTIGILIGAASANPFRTRPWRIAMVFVAMHVAAFSLLGGALLERYLLPALPIVLIAMAAGFSVSPALFSMAGTAALIGGLVWSNFWNPPYPFPYENNLAIVDFVELQQTAARFVEERYGNARIATAWPLSEAMERPDFGYVSYRHPVVRLSGFDSLNLQPVLPGSVDVFIVYSKEWRPVESLMNIAIVEKFWRRFFGYRAPVSISEIEQRYGMRQAGYWSQRGQWIVVLASQNPVQRPAYPF
jgi:hypothetical protein